MHSSENRQLWVRGKMVFSALFHTTLEILAACRNQSLLSRSCLLNSIQAQTYFQRSLNKNYATLCIEWNCFLAPFRILKMKIQVGNDHYQNGLSRRDFICVYLFAGKQSKYLPMTPSIQLSICLESYFGISCQRLTFVKWLVNSLKLRDLKLRVGVC